MSTLFFAPHHHALHPPSSTDSLSATINLPTTPASARTTSDHHHQFTTALISTHHLVSSPPSAASNHHSPTAMNVSTMAPTWPPAHTGKEHAALSGVASAHQGMFCYFRLFVLFCISSCAICFVRCFIHRFICPRSLPHQLNFPNSSPAPSQPLSAAHLKLAFSPSASASAFLCFITANGCKCSVC